VNLATIAATTDFGLVGRKVALADVTVERVGLFGFWAATAPAADSIFILPSERSLIEVRVGETVSLQGEIRPMPEEVRETLTPPYAWTSHVYVYAYTVRPAWPPPVLESPRQFK
jgi:hypothetical protein